jgi:hypothetical protein
MTGSGKISPLSSFFLVLLVTGLISCSKNTSQNFQPDLNVANDVVLVQRSLVNTFRMISMAVTDSALQQSHVAGIYGATVIYSPSQNKYMFSYPGNECPDSVIRSGRFYATLNGPFFNPGTQIIITYKNYSEDYHFVFGADTLICTNFNGGVTSYSILETWDSISKDTGRMIQYRLDQTIDLTGDIQSGTGSFTFAGQVSGISSGGFPFTAAISTPLSVGYNCPWIGTGDINLVIQGASVPDATMTFPSEFQCSDRVNYNFDGIVYQWHMTEGYLEK